MPFGQKLKSALASGIGFTKNLLQKAHHHGKQALSVLDQGMKTGSNSYQALKPALENLAPSQMKNIDYTVTRAQDKYNTIRTKIDQGESKLVQNVGMVMGNLKKKMLI